MQEWFPAPDCCRSRSTPSGSALNSGGSGPAEAAASDATPDECRQNEADTTRKDAFRLQPVYQSF